MGKETFTSDTIAEFRALSDTIGEKYGIVVHLAAVRGSRWSHAAGKNTTDIPVLPPERLKLNERMGVIIYYGHDVSRRVMDEVTRLVEGFRRKVGAGSGGAFE